MWSRRAAAGTGVEASPPRSVEPLRPWEAAQKSDEKLAAAEHRVAQPGDVTRPRTSGPGDTASKGDGTVKSNDERSLLGGRPRFTRGPALGSRIPSGAANGGFRCTPPAPARPVAARRSAHPPDGGSASRRGFQHLYGGRHGRQPGPHRGRRVSRPDRRQECRTGCYAGRDTHR